MIPFDFQPRTRLVFGPGKIEELGQLASELGARRAVVVSDPGVISAGHTARGIQSLVRAGIETHLFGGLHENPTTDDVDAGVKVARRYDPEILIGLGGGSSMDCAKGINFVYTNGGQIKDYWGTGKALKPMLPMIAVPTTAGTGSETQSFALISDSATHVKMACGDKKASFRSAILDPELTVTQPPRITALTGIDAISHALETFVTSRRNSASLAFSREAWRLLSGNFSKVLDKPDNIEARGHMLLGASFAGLAIENSMLGATHSAANPLTARYGTVHGVAVGMLLPHVVRCNAEVVDEEYRELARFGALPQNGTEAPGEPLAGYLESLFGKSGLPRRLSQCGVQAEAIPQLAAEAAEQWTAQFNPRRFSTQDFEALYRCAL